MLAGRLGLEKARIPYKDRHGLLWLGMGALTVEAGTLSFATPGYADLPGGTYNLPYQNISMLILEPGISLTHDVLRLCARHGVGVVAVGEGGVRLYTAPPLLPDTSDLARRQARAWADPEVRIMVARRLYAWRIGEVFPNKDISVLRGIEGARAKETYKLIARRYGIAWKGRRFDRENPNAADLPNQAINHAATAVNNAAAIACAAVGAIPQLGFIHEDSGQSFVLDIADLYRDEVTVPAAFASAAKIIAGQSTIGIERETRKACVTLFRETQLIAKMIDKIKDLFGVNDRFHNP
jgi:CRISPR-associated protein Cas1